MYIPDSVLRAALREYIAFGPDTLRPAEERLARRLPLVQPEIRTAALEVSRVAVGVAAKLAQEHVDGHRTQRSIRQELAMKFPWLRNDPSDSPEVRQPWWRRLFREADSESELAWHLSYFGFWVIK